MKKISESHPYWTVRSVVESSSISVVNMSYYEYRPQTISENRLAISVKREDFLDENHIFNIISQVPNGYELAMHSNVINNIGEESHLVMIDMATTSRAHLEKLKEFLDENFFQRITWYSSGRSFHGYGSDLLGFSDWVKFMGMLLLANKPKLDATVDPRWIGHRLLGGHSSLRWTKNTFNYLSVPSKLNTLHYNPQLAETTALQKLFN